MHRREEVLPFRPHLLEPGHDPLQFPGRFWETQLRHNYVVLLSAGRGITNQGPFYESGTITATVTKAVEETQEPEKRV